MSEYPQTVTITKAYLDRLEKLEELNHEKDNQIAGLELCNENLENRVRELDELKLGRIGNR